MDIDKISMPVDKAKEEWKRYNDLLKGRRDKFLQDMKKSMFELKQGRELIDIYKVIEKAGVNKELQPKLAIARADWKEVYFVKQDTGRGFFSHDTFWDRSKGFVDIPANIFQHWVREKKTVTYKDGSTDQADTWQIENKELKTKVPIIPSHLMPDNDLKDYYILWEVDVWENSVPKQDDPILLKRITENLFVILGAWEVTELEQSIISGL
ncbi:hypothetical protein LCGC14_0576930 [marine sediment metagenome]|uniref:Uncharacterized protein n=1 Tax=marine sediment metagenome TaxID=412755 RepID=A0A0F9U3S1_9ZZZZ